MAFSSQNFDNNVKIKHNLKGLAKQAELQRMPFGSFIEQNKIISDFKSNPATKTIHVSIKRKSVATALKDFKHLYDVDKFYSRFNSGPDRKDDVIEIFYTTK